MNEMRLPEQPQSSSPHAPPLPAAPRKQSLSLMKGLAIAWAITCGGGLLVLQTMNIFTALWLSPVVTAIIAVVLIFTGKQRLGVGMLLGLLSMAAVVLLLVAACFGLVGGAFH